MFKPLDPIAGTNPPRFRAFAVLTDEQARQALHDSWTTPEQQAHNAWLRAERQPCGRCHGRGCTRKDQRVGCHVCLGVGHVPKG